MDLALVESAKAVSSQRLHDADIDKRVVVLHERRRLELEVAAKSSEIMIEQLPPQFGRQVRLGVEQQGSDVIMQRALAPSLVVEEKRLPITQHDVARLKIPIQKIIMPSAQQKFRQPPEIIFERLLVEGNARQPKKVVFEIIQVPADRLAVKAGPRIGHLVI